MKKLIVAVIVAGIMIAGGCCKKGGCSANPSDPSCDRCNTEYCKYIGTKLQDERVLKGETVTFKEGDEEIIIRPVPKEKITKWKTFDEMNPGMVSKPVEVVSEEAAAAKPAPKKVVATKVAPKAEEPKKAEPKKEVKTEGAAKK